MSVGRPIAEVSPEAKRDAVDAATATATAPALSRRAAWTLVLIATATMSVSYVDRQALAVLAPTVTAQLDISDTRYGLLASAFSIAYLLFAPIAGWLVDRFGARRALMVAVLVWSAVAGLHALALGFASLFALRILLGIAEAPSFPGAAQTVHRALPPEDRARGFGVLFTGSSIGAILAAPIATGLLGAFHSWRAAFIGTAIVGLLWVPAWMHFTGRGVARDALDRAHATSSSVARPSPLQQLANPAVVRAVVLVIGCAPIVGFSLLWGSKVLVGSFHVPQTGVGRYLWLPPLLFDLGAIGFGDRASRDRTQPNVRRLMLLAGLIALAVAGLHFVHTAWGAVSLLAVALIGCGGVFALATSEMLANVPGPSVSAASGMTAAAQSIAYVVTSPLIGWSVDKTKAYTMASVGLAVWMMPCLAYWMATKNERADEST